MEVINEVLGDVPVFTRPGEHCSELRSLLENLEWFDLSYCFEGAGSVTCMETHKRCAVALCASSVCSRSVASGSVCSRSVCMLSDIYQSLFISCASVKQYDHFFQCQRLVQQHEKDMAVWTFDADVLVHTYSTELPLNLSPLGLNAEFQFPFSLWSSHLPRSTGMQCLRRSG